jgi:hypothetical protein
MEAVTISDAGANLVVTGRERAAVEAALNELIVRGARIISQPAQLGSKWVATCEKPVEPEDFPGAAGTREVQQKATLQGVKITNTGEQLMLTGSDKATVKAALDELVRRGARALSEPVAFGSGWVATCTDPSPQRAACLVETLGLHIIVSSENRGVVEEKVKELQAAGAKLVTPPNQSGDRWVAVCDRGGLDGVMIVR